MPTAEERTEKRKREESSTGRVDVDRIMQHLQADPTLQNALDAASWNQLSKLHLAYLRTGVGKKAFVDGCCAVVGPYKMLSIVKQLSTRQREGHPLLMRRVSSLSSTSSGSPATPGGAEVHRIISSAQQPSRKKCRGTDRLHIQQAASSSAQ